MYLASALQDQISNLEVNDLKFKQASDVGPLLSQLLQYALAIAGLILFGMIISAGFIMLTSGGDPKAMDMGKSRLTHALLGFLIVFAAFWIAQILQIIFNIPIINQ